MRIRSLTSLLAVVAVLLAVAAVPMARQGMGPTASAEANATPPDPDLRRAVQLSLVRRAVPAGGTEIPVGGDDIEPYVTGPGEGSPEIIPPPPLEHGTGALYAVGDSVLLGTEPYLRSTLVGWDLRLDARVSRGVPEGLDLVRMNADRVGDVLVLVLGHNYGSGNVEGWLRAELDRLDHVQRIVVVTVAEWSPAQVRVNDVVRELPEDYDNVVVADWAAVLAANPQFLRDHVHPSRSGATALANLITVMVGPAPPRDGVAPPRPRLLPIPDEPSSGGGSSSGSWPAPVTGGGGSTPSTTSTTAPSASSTTTTEAPSTTSTTAPSASSTTTTEAPSTTSTTSTTAPPATSTTTAPPTSAP